ncbi:esterase/lipase family protein [Agromyces sp. M3QZ16-3]|uniref:esterase/lipase family protein n=1 Tax=Agromyces sp. M3QZ16-3 TaxID=3447585 RepID=UPI003F68F6C4
MSDASRRPASKAGTEASAGLFIFVPGLPVRRRGRPGWVSLIERMRAELGPGWRVEVFEHGVHATSRTDPDEVVRHLAAQIRDWTGELSTDVEVPTDIILVGHSFGGVLARAAFLHDAGTADHPGREWTRLVRRLVLLGSPNAGFRLDAPGTPAAWRLAYALATPFFDFTIENVQSGGYWITDLRLRWLETFRRLESKPKVVQVLGTSDRLVTHEDILDLRFMPNSTVYEIPGADHPGLIAIDDAPSPSRRYEQVKTAILGRADEAVDDEKQLDPSPTAFILHGIRASALGTWVEDLATAYRDAAASDSALVVSPDTGYFTAMEFALPGTRRRKVHEFLKLYGDAYATRDPDLFVFAGHSNGTYMMARALDRVPSMRFRRIFLAGTVLPRRFDWQRRFDQRQIGYWDEDGAWSPGTIRNDRATRDVPVGMLCSWLSGLGSADVGTAGVSGFENVSSVTIDQSRTFVGGHGAALAKPAQLVDVAGYLAGSTPPASAGPSADLPRMGTTSPLFARASRAIGLRIVAWGAITGAGVLAGRGLVALGRARGPGAAIGTGAAGAIGLWTLLRSI